MIIGWMLGTNTLFVMKVEWKGVVSTVMQYQMYRPGSSKESCASEDLDEILQKADVAVLNWGLHYRHDKAKVEYSTQMEAVLVKVKQWLANNTATGTGTAGDCIENRRQKRRKRVAVWRETTAQHFYNDAGVGELLTDVCLLDPILLNRLNILNISRRVQQ